MSQWPAGAPSLAGAHSWGESNSTQNPGFKNNVFNLKRKKGGKNIKTTHIFSAFWPHLRARAFISPPHTQSVIQSHQGSGLRLLNPSVASPNTTPPPPLTRPSGPPQRHLSLRCRTPCHLTRAPGALNRSPPSEMHSYVVNYLCSLFAQTTLCYMYTVYDMILRGNIDEHFYVNHFTVSRKKIYPATDL